MIEKKLTFLHRVTCDYSEAFLRRAQFTLAQAGVQLEVVSGQPWEGEGLVDVVDKLPFGRRVRNKRICGPMYYGEGSAIFTSTADMVVLEQSNAALDNYPLLTRRWIEKHFLEDNRVKVAFWGHGANLNAGGSQVIRRWWKRTFTTKVDWWFAYTELSARIVTDAGFPRNRITVLQNTIDTTELQRAKALVSEPMLQELRLQLFKEQEKHPTGVFCGRLVELKWIPFLLEGAERIHEYLPEFRMVMVGDGPYSAQVAGFAKTRPWFAWVGAKRGAERVKYLALGDVWLNPGMVGLAIVDAFVMGLPMMTTRNDIHSPEIAYLKEDMNGIMAEVDTEQYAQKVVAVLKDAGRLAYLKANAMADAKEYTVEKMTSNFVSGVLQCLRLK